MDFMLTLVTAWSWHWLRVFDNLYAVNHCVGYSVRAVVLSCWGNKAVQCCCQGTVFNFSQRVGAEKRFCIYKLPCHHYHVVGFVQP